MLGIVSTERREKGKRDGGGILFRFLERVVVQGQLQKQRVCFQSHHLRQNSELRTYCVQGIELGSAKNSKRRKPQKL